MDAVGADQDVTAHGPGMRACTIEEIGRDAALVLGEGPKTASGVDCVRPEPLLDGAMNHALQPAAMDRELRHVMAGIDATGFAPDFLAVAVEIIKLVGTNSDVVELL